MSGDHKADVRPPEFISGPMAWPPLSDAASLPSLADCLIDSITDILFYKTLNGVYLCCNQAFADHLGRSKTEIIGKTDFDLYPKEEAELHWMSDRRMIASGAPRQTEEWLVSSDGRQVFLETLKTVYRKECGEPIGILCLGRDMTEHQLMEEEIHRMNAELQQRVAERTMEIKKANVVLQSEIAERKQAQDALQESEEKYRAIFENASEGILIIRDGKIIIPNPGIVKITGYGMEELTALSFQDFVHPDDRSVVLERLGKGLHGGGVTKSHEFRIVRKNGDTRWVQASAACIPWEGNSAMQVFLTDITDHKSLEEQYRHSQKLEAIGTLAGGLAHDFNNILMGIQGHTSMMLFDAGASPSHHERLKSIEELVLSGADLTRQLLGFARKGKYEVKAVDPNRLIRKTVEMFGRTKKEMKIDTRLQPGAWPIEADAGQIEQVLLNLFVNAWQAMPGGGDLCISTENVFSDGNALTAHPMKRGRYVKIRVTDTGVGMDERTRQRIFEPFFTTKEMGRGTGLGLATVYGIINGHGGCISVTSQKNKGTTFAVYLPASDREIAEEKEAQDQLFTGRETILLVDDEEVIINIGSDILTTLGYRVLTARSGLEAVDLYRNLSEPIHLVILDMIMPGGSGGRTFDALKAINPGVKVILSSGYSLDGEASEIMARGCLAFIQKPYRVADLSRKIREALDIAGHGASIFQTTLPMDDPAKDARGVPAD